MIISPSRIAFSAKYSKLFVTDRLLHAVYMVDMHRPSNITLVTGGAEQGYAKASAERPNFNNPSGIVAHGDQLYICDKGNGRIVNVASLFCHASQIPKHDDENENEEKECAVRRVRKVEVKDISLISKDEEFLKFLSPNAMCGSLKQQLKIYLSDLRQNKILVISSITHDKGNFSGHIRKVNRFPHSSVLDASLIVTQDEKYLLVGDCEESSSTINICCLENLEET